MRFTIPALAAALGFALVAPAPANAWIQHYQPIAAPTGAPSMSEIESWRDGLTNGNAALVQAHRDRLNRVLVAMGQPSPTKVQVNEGGYWHSHGVNRGWRDKWVDSDLAQCGNIPSNRCREVTLYSAMTAGEARKWYEKFGNDRWKRIVNHLADLQFDFDVNSWGSWAELPREAFDVVTSSFDDNVSRYNLGAPDTQTPAQMGLAGARYTGELDGKLSQSYKDRFDSLDPNNVHYWDANPLTVELGIEDDAVTRMYARVWFANLVAPKDNPDTPLWVVHGTVDKWSGIDISNGRFESSSSLPVESPSNDGRLASNGGGTIQGDFYGNGSVVAGVVKTDNVIGTFKADKQ